MDYNNKSFVECHDAWVTGLVMWEVQRTLWLTVFDFMKRCIKLIERLVQDRGGGREGKWNRQF